MTIGSLIQALVEAINRQEGHSPEYTNPGSLRGAPWRVSPPTVNGFWNPASRVEGISGEAHVVALHIAEGNSLRQLIYIWAPPSENDSAAYLTNVQDWTGLNDAECPLWDYITP